MKARAVILAGGEGTRLSVLTAKRSKPAVPFAGKYRIIDFTLSNCVNSNIFDILILTQYRPHSLNEHIGRGQPWDLDRSFTGGVQMLQPYKGRKAEDWYSGTADAVYQNLSFVVSKNPDHVVLLSGDHIYQMDYDALLNFHIDKNADITVCALRVPLEEASRYGIMKVDKKDRIVDFVEKPSKPPSDLASMGIYVFKTKVLEQVLTEDASRESSSHDFGKDIIPRMLAEGRPVFAYPFNGYWIDVGTIDAFWGAHMDLLQDPPPFNLHDRSRVVHTRSEERAPAMIKQGATVRNSLITNGCVISEGAEVSQSILSPGVHVGPNAIVRESVILTDSYIEAGAVIERCIIDKEVVIGHDAKVGKITDSADLGITVVGKGARIPAKFTIGRSATLDPDVGPQNFADFTDQTVPNGKKVSVDKKKDKDKDKD
jgi:glucose-1-phosphate adenylyltransferase